MHENPQRLLPIVETVILQGRQNIPFRGHRDYGELKMDTSSVYNEGNFREMLRFWVQSGDTNLENHLKTASSRATYISKNTQNELIKCCGDEITETPLKNIQKAKFFSVVFDETTDISNISQMSLIIRHVQQEGRKFVPYEDFVRFVDLYAQISKQNKDKSEIPEPKMTGKCLGSIVLETLKELNIDVTNCLGITTDGCSLMVSEKCGAVTTIKQEAKNAVYSPCQNHMLNLSIAQASRLPNVRNAVGIMKRVISFFFDSPKKSVILRNVLGYDLEGLFETRWIERHEGVLQFRLAIAKIIQALDMISLWGDTATSSKAAGLSLALRSTEFLVTLICLSDVLSCTMPLSRFLQSKNVDLKSAQDMMNRTVTQLNRKREMCEVKFQSVFDEITSVAEIELGTQITVPRTTGRQLHRANYPTDDPVAYYRQSVYIPIVENVLEDLKARFPEETLQLYNFSNLFPTTNVDADESKETIQSLATRYSTFFNKPEELAAQNIKLELESWHIKLEEKNHSESTAIELIELCDPDIYPYLHTLFRMFITLPISNASSERSFSCLRRLKTWLRSTMGEDRLVGLALLHIHRDLLLEPGKVINRYARTRKHRLDFAL